eukprot:scaffold43819_cov21-Tisochrysis_lutea.AAC.1
MDCVSCRREQYGAHSVVHTDEQAKSIKEAYDVAETAQAVCWRAHSSLRESADHFPPGAARAVCSSQRRHPGQCNECGCGQAPVPESKGNTDRASSPAHQQMMRLAFASVNDGVCIWMNIKLPQACLNGSFPAQHFQFKDVSMQTCKKTPTDAKCKEEGAQRGEATQLSYEGSCPNKDGQLEPAGAKQVPAHLACTSVHLA